jgi:2-dehydro-3-deoxy-D-arabinonate dehydratase
MYLTRHQDIQGPRWALDGYWLPQDFNLKLLLELPGGALVGFLKAIPVAGAANDKLMAPIEAEQEVWACGVTYARSRDAREAETEVKDIYEKVYEAKRPEIFFKAIGWRTVGHRGTIRIRQDTRWNVPESELTLVINCQGEIIGYCVGNDLSSRDIEGENPLYLPQAKIYNGSCAIGPGIRIAQAEELRDLQIEIEIVRENQLVFEEKIRSSQMKRSFEELVFYLTAELRFPHGVFLMTGTGIIPPDNFTLQKGDLVRIKIGSLMLENEVQD